MQHPSTQKGIANRVKSLSPKVSTVVAGSKHVTLEILQWISEHLPYIQLAELHRKKTLISGIPIQNKFQKRGRRLQVIPQTGSLYSIFIDGKTILVKAKEDLITILNTQELPDHIDKEIGLAMLRIVLGITTYYGLTKPGDTAMYRKIFLSKNINSSDDPNLIVLPHDKEE